MNPSVNQTETLRRWLPALLLVIAVWLAARSMRNLGGFVLAFAWVYCWTGGRLPFGN